MRFSFAGHLTPQDKAQSDYFYVPFDLPVPCSRLNVRYAYSDRIPADRPEGGNVIDIGIFDPQGSGFPGGAGFRGWSGSDRNEFMIAVQEATPGYRPGPLPAGRYQVILGLYRIWPRGADYEVQIEAEPDRGSLSPADPRPSPSTGIAATPEERLPDSPSYFWLQGDLHTHTHHSDGKGSPEILVAKARQLGLDFLAITDHNTTSAHALFPTLAGGELVLIAGQEVTTYYGHMNIWGTSRWCDFRCRVDADMAIVIDLAHQSGGMCSLNHPRSGDLAWGYRTNLPVETIEVWNGPWPNHNLKNLELWDELLRNGRRLPAVGGSDYHCPAGEETGFVRLGQPTTWVKSARRSEAAILEALRSGRACVSAHPCGPRLDLRASSSVASAGMGEALSLPAGEPVRAIVEVEGGADLSLRIISEAGLLHETRIAASQAEVQVSAPVERYLRAELVGDWPSERLPPNAPPNLDLRQWRFAISNPVYIHSS